MMSRRRGRWPAFEKRQGRCYGASGEDNGTIVAYSRDGDQSFQAMVITDSGDRDHAQQVLSSDAAASTTDDCICAGNNLLVKLAERIARSSRRSMGGPRAWRGVPHERRSDARGWGLWAGGAIAGEAITLFSFRRRDGADCRP